MKPIFLLLLALAHGNPASSEEKKEKLFWIGGSGAEEPAASGDPAGSTIRLREHEGEGGEGGKKKELSLKDANSFRDWIADLCGAPPVAEGIERRKTIGGAGVQKPTNALGSLLLLLENYEDDITYVTDCREQRKTFQRACRQQGFGPIPGRTIVDDPAAAKVSSDLLLVHKGAARGTEALLKKAFGKLLEMAGLDGSPGSVEKARKIRHAAEHAATCKIRAVATTPAPRR